MMSGSTYLIGDARTLGETWRRRRFPKPDLILTSPPYFDVKNYGDLAGQIGFRQTYDEYLSDVCSVLQQCYEVSSNSATLWLILDTLRRNGVTRLLPFEMAERLRFEYRENNTWKLKDVIIWSKPKNIPWNAKGRFRNGFEYILFFAKNDDFAFDLNSIREVGGYQKWWLSYPERYNENGKAPSNVWEFTIPIQGWGRGYQDHLCPFPFPLVERIVSLVTYKGNTVLDPFAGSGSVLAIAAEMGRRAIGFDINKGYKAIYRSKVKTGARKYWMRRRKQIELNRPLTGSFRTTILSLRKIKSAMEVITKLNRGIKRRSAAIVYSQRRDRLSYHLLVETSSPTNDRTLIHQESLREVEARYRLKIQLHAFSRRHHVKKLLSNKTLYLYRKESIHRYLRKISIDEYLERTWPSGELLSNLRVHLDGQRGPRIPVRGTQAG